MSLVKVGVFDGALMRAVNQGDIVAGGEIISQFPSVASAIITATQLLAGLINRTGPTGAYGDTTDSAANIIAASVANYGYVAPNTGISSGAAIQIGITFRTRFLNTVGFANTIVAGAGVTLVNGVVNATSVKDFLVQVTNGTPPQVFAGNQVTGSTVVTGLSQFQTSQISVGMLVTGSGIPANTLVSAVQVGVGFTLSAAATSTITLNALSFSPTVTITGVGQGLL